MEEKPYLLFLMSESFDLCKKRKLEKLEGEDEECEGSFK